MVLVLCAGSAWGQDAATPAAETRVIVLDTYGMWRIFGELAPPMLASGEKVKVKHEWMNYETPGAAEGWTAPGFDDSGWYKGPLTLAPKTPLMERESLRGKFMVTDPGKATGLTLSVTYKGGLIVTVNGKEVQRAHIAAGASLAEGPAGEARHLEGFELPIDGGKPGVPLLRLEAVRSPVAEAAGYYFENACEFVSVRLSAPAGSGVVQNVVRPEGFQVWNVEAMATDFTLDFGDPCEPLSAVKIVGARNGAFSGKVMVGSTKTIQRLKVTAGDLKGDGGVVAGRNVRVRYGAPWGTQRFFTRDRIGAYPTCSNRMGLLLEKAPAEVAVMEPVRGPFDRPAKADFSPVPGAVVPVWLTVTVPKDAGSGRYTGKVKIEAAGEKPVEVPVELTVADYTLPDTQEFVSWVDVIECPDTLALEYEVPLWSEKHWKMIEQSFRLIGETGSRTVYIPLIAHTNLGNEESMVRWIRKADGTCEYDYSIMEKYLDVAEKAMGKPKLVIPVVWETYMMPAKDATEGKAGSRQRQMAQFLTERKGVELGSGPVVTVLDPETGKTENMELPTLFETEESRKLWGPLMKGIRERLAKRGLDKAMMTGLLSDAWAKDEEMALISELSGGVPWVLQSHEGLRGGRKMHGKYTIGYQTVVWSVKYSDDNGNRPPGGYYGTGVKSMMGWGASGLAAAFDRSNGWRELEATTRWRQFEEVQITGGQRGQGRIGGEYWPVLRNKKGERVGRAWGRYPESDWRQLNITTALLGPGPDGPVAVDMMEAFREGVQECEARIVLEKALYDEGLKKKLGDELAKQVEGYLYGRHMMMWLGMSDQELHGSEKEPANWRSNWSGLNNSGTSWFLGSGFHERSAQLYELAGKVSRALQAKGVEPQGK